jgi:transposase
MELSMLGEKRRGDPQLFHYNLNLEKRVRSDHPLRRVLQCVDFDFVRKAVANCYGGNGHKSEDPIVIIKLMFLLFFDNIKSERELVRMVGERLDYLWFLGLGLDDEVPHHSVLSKARRRWGGEVFEELFVQVIVRCVQAGLVGGDKIHLDGSLVAANASQRSVAYSGEEMILQLRKVYRAEERKLEKVSEQRPKKSYKKKANSRLMSRTDPDAAVVKQNDHTHAQPRYKNHRVVDDRQGVITAMISTRGDVEENSQLPALVRQHQNNTGEAVQTVVADSQYGTQDNLVWCAQRGIQPHMSEFAKNRTSEVFSPELFVYDAEADVYRCPAGKTLQREKTELKKRQYAYRARARECRNCSLRGQCTQSRQGGRTIYRHAFQQDLERARLQSGSACAKSSLRRRRHLMEGSFADAANNHHFKRARWRRCCRQRMQDLLIGVCQNVRILLRHARLRPAAALALSARDIRDLRMRFRLAFSAWLLMPGAVNELPIRD